MIKTSLFISPENLEVFWQAGGIHDHRAGSSKLSNLERSTGDLQVDMVPAMNLLVF